MLIGPAGETQHYSLARGPIVAYEPRNGATLTWGASFVSTDRRVGARPQLRASFHFLYYRSGHIIIGICIPFNSPIRLENMLMEGL